MLWTFCWVGLGDRPFSNNTGNIAVAELHILCTSSYILCLPDSFMTPREFLWGEEILRLYFGFFLLLLACSLLFSICKCARIVDSTWSYRTFCIDTDHRFSSEVQRSNFRVRFNASSCWIYIASPSWIQRSFHLMLWEVLGGLSFSYIIHYVSLYFNHYEILFL